MAKQKTSGKRKSGPVRAVIELNPHRVVGGMNIPGLMEYPAEWESRLERNLIATLIMCIGVRSLATQHAEEAYRHDGASHTYTADLKLEIADRAVIIEVKPLTILLRDDNLNKYLAIGNHFRTSNREFVILTDDQINIAPRINSILLLRRYASGQIPPGILETAVSGLDGNALSISMLIEKTGLELRAVYSLIAQRKLTIDWSQPLRSDSLVSIPNMPLKGLHFEDICASGRFSGLVADLSLGYRPQDKRVLEDAKTRRQLDRIAHPWGVVGGLPSKKPFRDLRAQERISRKPWNRGNIGTREALFTSRKPG